MRVALHASLLEERQNLGIEKRRLLGAGDGAKGQKDDR
jgi:hypothetical protein